MIQTSKWNEINRLRTGISAVVRSRSAFLACIVIVSALELLLCTLAPASYNLRDIVNLVASGHYPLGPWTALYPPLYSGSGANFTQLRAWYVAAPINMQFTSLLFRLPIFLLGLGTGVLVYASARSICSPLEGRLASLVWFLNPFSFFAVDLLGVPDMLAIFIVAAAFWLVIVHRPVLSSAVLALGVFVKLYPILLLPPLLFFAHTGVVKRKSLIAMLCAGIAGLLAYLLWVLSAGSVYLAHYSPVTQPVDVFVGSYITNAYGYVFVLIIFYGLVGFFGKKSDILGLMLTTLLVYYLISSPFPQYLVWAAPFMAVDVAVNRRRGPLFVLFYALAFVQWFLVSPGFVTPSGYSLLMIPLIGNNLPWYSTMIVSLLESPTLILLIPLASSSFYGSVVFYVLDVARSWFRR